MPLRLLLRSIFGRRRVEEDLDDELSFHLAMEAAALRERTGASDVQAERQARRRLGGIAQVKEACRDALRMGWLDAFVRDIRYALRSFRRSPTFTLVALLSMAVGIGANCAAFTWADALLLRPLPVPRSSDIVTIGSTTSIDGALGNVLRASYPEYVVMRDRATSFEGLLAYTTFSTALASTRGGAPQLKLGAMVSANFFDVLDVRPALGRSFVRSEGAVPGRDAVIVLGDRVWRSQFGADPSIVGKRVYLTGIPFVVIGVAPREFLGIEQFVRAEFYVPLMMWDQLLPHPHDHPLEVPDARALIVKGRLKRGIGLSAAQADLSSASRELTRRYPSTNRDRQLVMRTELQMRAAQIPAIPMFIALLMTLAAAVLLVACANMAALLTSRGPARAREMAIRSAIGAGRSGLVRQLLTESLLLATGGAVIGVAVGYASMQVFRRSAAQMPTDLPIGFTFDLDHRALAFSMIAAGVSALLFGLAPAIRASRVDLTALMKGASEDTGGRRSWGRSMLVGGQVAISVVLLTIATFTYRAFREELSHGPGYRIDHLVMMSFDTGLVRYSEDESARFYERLLERVRATAGVRSATFTTAVPMQTVHIDSSTVAPDGHTLPAARQNVEVMSASVGEEYFSTIQIPIVRGRAFRREDTSQTPPVVIVNELFAQHYWPGEDPVGKRLRVADGRMNGLPAEVVGVSKNSKYVLLVEPPTEYIYFPYRQRPSGYLILLVHSDEEPSGPGGLISRLRGVVRGLEADMPVYDVRTMRDFYQLSSVGLMNMIIGVIAAMGTMGLALSMVGLYGLIAYGASRRTREIGIRIALGAGRGSVLRMVMNQGLLLAMAGLAVGLFASLLAGKLLAATFVGPAADNDHDFTSLLLVGAGVLAVTGLAAYIPARHASRTDPLNALRYE